MKKLLQSTFLFSCLFFFTINFAFANKDLKVFEKNILRTDSLENNKLPSLIIWQKNRNVEFPLFNIIKDNRRDLKYFEDNKFLDCIKYNLKTDKNSYFIGEPVKVSVKLEYIDGLNESWKNEDCQNLL